MPYSAEYAVTFVGVMIANNTKFNTKIRPSTSLHALMRGRCLDIYRTHGHPTGCDLLGGSGFRVGFHKASHSQLHQDQVFSLIDLT